MGKSKKPEVVDHVADDSEEDEEIPEDEAFNSEDERKYGSFFEQFGKGSKGSKGSSKDESDIDNDNDDSEVDSGSEEDSDADSDDGIASDDDDSDEGDGGQYMLGLLDKMDGNDDKSEKERKTSGIASHIKESEFASSVVPTAGLTLDSLMEGIEDTKGFGVIQKTMRKVAEGQTTAAPLGRTVSARAQRKVHYNDQSKEVSRWIHAVQENRQAETLDLRPKERMEVTREVLVEKFVPTTDFEKQIHAALTEAGQEDEEAMLKAEEAALQDDLGSNQITMEEYKKRRGQLAKMRALMFYHEQKRHHMKKIKSRKYRRIRKKQKERQKEAEAGEDPDLARELLEKEEVERMQERMTLAHKNTSKWAKRILKRGKNVDVDTRRALSAQLKRGDDLLLRMQATKAGEDEDDDSDEDLVETARKVLADTESSNDHPAQRKGLFQLSFMQKGIEKQREKAKEEARELLMELEANEGGGDFDSNGSGSEDDDVDDAPKRSKKAKIASKEEMKHVLNEGELVASSLRFGNSNSIAVNGGIDIDLGLDGTDTRNSKTSTRVGAVSEHSATMAIQSGTNDGAKETQSVKTTSSPRKQGKTNPAPTSTSTDQSNPWLAASGVPDSAGGATQRSKTPRVSKTGIVDVQSAVDLLDGPLDATAPVARIKQVAETSETETAPMEKRITMLTQEELVRKAFVTPSEKEVDEEFAKEKEGIEEQEEDPTRKKRKEKAMDTVSGWGSWTGTGAPLPRPPRKLPKRLQAPEKKLTKRKRDDAKKPHVIMSEKRVKKLADSFMVSQVPHPFTSREEYERAMAGGVGREWNVSKSFKDMTRPEIMTRPGKIIQPLSKRAKQTRPAAKF